MAPSLPGARQHQGLNSLLPHTLFQHDPSAPSAANTFPGPGLVASASDSESAVFALPLLRARRSREPPERRLQAAATPGGPTACLIPAQGGVSGALGSQSQEDIPIAETAPHQEPPIHHPRTVARSCTLHSSDFLSAMENAQCSMLNESGALPHRPRQPGPGLLASASESEPAAFAPRNAPGTPPSGAFRRQPRRAGQRPVSYQPRAESAKPWVHNPNKTSPALKARLIKNRRSTVHGTLAPIPFVRLQ